MVEINWQAVFGVLLIVAGGGWSAYQWWSGKRTAKPPEATVTRSADEPPPPGAVEWVKDIHQAMGRASADSVLEQLELGANRDQARDARIQEIEGSDADEVTA